MRVKCKMSLMEVEHMVVGVDCFAKFCLFIEDRVFATSPILIRLWLAGLRNDMLVVI